MRLRPVLPVRACGRRCRRRCDPPFELPNRFVSVPVFVYGRESESRALTHAGSSLMIRLAAGSGPRGILRRVLAPSSANHTAMCFQYITGSSELAQSLAEPARPCRF